MSDNIKKTNNDTFEIIEIHLQTALALAKEAGEPTLEYVIGMGIQEVGSKYKRKKRA